MKILIISQNFYPDNFAINDIVEKMVERGDDVTVLTGLPDYTTSKIPKEYKFGRNRKQVYKSAKVYRVSTIARRRGSIFRSLNYISYAVSASIFAIVHKFNDFDYIYVWEVSPVTMAIPAIVLKKKYKKPLLIYCLDIWPECVKAMGFKEKMLSYKIIRKLSKWIYGKANLIAVTSKPFKKYLNSVCDIDMKKMRYLPQYASSDLLYRDFTKKKNGLIEFIYIGNIGKAQNIDCILKAFSIIKDRKDIKLHILGNGSEFKNMKSLANKLGLSEMVMFYGSKPYKESLEYYKKADACLIGLDGSNHIGDTLPGKIQTYMAVGKPIIGALNGAGNGVIKESKCGIAVKSGDYKGLAKAIIEFSNNKEKYIDAGENARNYFKTHFTEEEHFGKLDEIVRELT